MMLMLSSPSTRLFPLITAFALALIFSGCASTRDMNPEIYDERADGEQQLAETLRQAKVDHKRVLLNLGANWCSDSQAMFQVLSTNSEIQRVISEHYVFEMIDVNERGLKARNTRLVARFGNPIAAGIPVLLVLDENGTVLNSDPGERLADSDHAFPVVVLAYLRKWAGQYGLPDE